jgi:hypothetical protein
MEHFMLMQPGGDVDDYQNAHVYVGFTSRLLAGMGMADKKDVSLLMRLALDYIRHQVMAGTIMPGRSHEFTFTTSNPPDFGGVTWKSCDYQKQSDSGLRCAAAHERDPGRGVTTKALCQACALPSADLLCDDLVHPVVVGDAEPNHLTLRNLVSAKCNIASGEFDARSALAAIRCVPHGYSCWHKVVSKPEQEKSTELSAIVDHINLVFRQKFGQPLFVIQKAQTIATLSDLAPVEAREEFEAKVQALGRLIEHMTGRDLAKSVGVTTSNPGSISQLEAFLSAKRISSPPTIQVLRDIVTARVDMSHDVTSQDVLAAFRRLGITLPPQDYDQAWKCIVGAFVGALRNLERVV